MAQIELLFLGTGTSAGVPMIGCHCDVCTSSDPHDHRDRPSVLISYNNVNVLVDTTPEMRLQCIRNHIDMIEAVVYTHAHADHVMGLDDLRRFNAIKKGPLDAWADAKTFAALNRCFGYAFAETNVNIFRPHLIHRLIDGEFEITGEKWTPIDLIHGNEPTLGFRIGTLAYCTDVSAIPEKSFELLENLDVLVLDALQYKPHEKHFSLEQSVEAAKKIGAKQTLFTHIGHAMSHEKTNRDLPESMRLAFDGQRVSAGD